MKLYIENSYSIGPFINHEFDDLSIFSEQDSVYKVAELDYYNYLSSNIARRASRSTKFGMFCALKCLEGKDVNNIEGIIVGTSLGGLKNYEDFSNQLINKTETNLSPNNFLQSLHSTLSGNLALELGVNQYNITYTNRGDAFEIALLDAGMHFLEGRKEVLVGAADEISSNYVKSVIKDNFLHLDNPNSCLLGEGASFFRLLNKKSKDTVTIVATKSFYNINELDYLDNIKNILSDNKINIDSIDLIISGLKNRDFFKDFKEKNIPTIFYKDYIGEYPTSISFAVWLGENIIRKNKIPKVFNKDNEGEIKNILVLNEYRKYKSVIILSKNF